MYADVLFNLYVCGRLSLCVVLQFGLHDCNPGDHIDATTYAKNLEFILTKARAASGAVVFVTTTPFFKYKAYSYSCVLQYNSIAKRVVAKLNSAAVEEATSANITIADLFAHVEQYCGSNYTTCPIQLDGNLHFSTAWSPPYSTDTVTHQPLQVGIIFWACTIPQPT